MQESRSTVPAVTKRPPWNRAADRSKAATQAEGCCSISQSCKSMGEPVILFRRGAPSFGKK